MIRQKNNPRIIVGKTVSILAVMLFIATSAFAQWTIDEDFEGGVIPTDWTIYDVDGDGNQ
ncbi:MAG: hypothetical protein H8E11_04660 [Candidatus Cloacimonetes bacterium]|nr:hypothetical protein [Candidatus Cloacimonadota bacterium]